MDTFGITVYAIISILTGVCHLCLWWQLTRTIKMVVNGQITMPVGYIPTMVITLLASGLAAYGSFLEIIKLVTE